MKKDRTGSFCRRFQMQGNSLISKLLWNGQQSVMTVDVHEWLFPIADSVYTNSTNIRSISFCFIMQNSAEGTNPREQKVSLHVQLEASSSLWTICKWDWFMQSAAKRPLRTDFVITAQTNCSFSSTKIQATLLKSILLGMLVCECF